MVTMKTRKNKRIIDNVLKTELKVEENIIQYSLIKKGDHIIIGLSGGPDSVCLFFILKKFSEKIGFTISVVHVNHNLRGDESDLDEKFVVEICKKYDVECRIVDVDCDALAKEHKITTEEAGRNVRYQSFYEEANRIVTSNEKAFKNITEFHNIKIAVAQNKNDQAETVIMRIMRGTGINGLSGMEYKRKGEKDIEIIRPILNLTRDEIEAYLEAENITFQIDKTNEESIYTRNRIRLELLPYMKNQFNSNIIDSLCRVSKLAQIDNNYFQQEVEKVLEKAILGEKYITIEIQYIKDLHAAIKNRVLLEMIKEAGLNQGFSEVHIEDVLEMIERNAESKVIDLPDGYQCALSYGTLRFFDQKHLDKKEEEIKRLKENFKIELIDYQELIARQKINLSNKVNVAIFDGDKIIKAIYGDKKEWCEDIRDIKMSIRYKIEGDYFSLEKNKGRKKIKSLFVDEKVYREMRNLVPLVTIGNDVLWILGGDVTGESFGLKKSRKSSNYKLNKNTKNILYIEYLCDI